MPDDFFAPLTEHERAVVVDHKPAGASTKTPIVPVPTDAPPMRFKHPKHGEPTKAWPYHDATGNLIGYAARFDFLDDSGHPAKDVLPITYCDLGNGRRGWRSKAFPTPRPLYRMPELLADPDALVIICEGEKKAERVPDLFPGCVGTCTAGGSKAAKLSDLSVLTGRRLAIWPDNDKPGRDFAEDVARMATEAGAASVAVVKVPADWPASWDIADEPPAGVTVETLRAMLAAAEPWQPPAATPSTAPPAGDDDDLPQRDRLILCGMTRATLWRDADHIAYATVEVGEHLEHYAIRSTAYRRHLLKVYGARYPQTIPNGDSATVIPGSPSSQSLTDALGSLEAAACAGREKVPAVRIGEHEGNVVLDLGTPDWSAVVIGPAGWRVVARPPVPFIRPAGLRPLPIPVSGGDINELRHFINIANDGDFMLAVAFLLAALKRKGPFPIAVVNGEQGSAKSTFCRVLRRLVDPNSADLRSPPKDERDTLIAATNGWMLGYDNLSFIDGEQSDWFCRIATGGGFATRALYTNGEEHLINVCRPVLLNGIPSLASRPDLADRAVALTLPVIPESARKSEVAFWASFDQAAPRILGALLDGVSMALRNLPTVKLARLPRMADFALWSVAAFPAYGWTAGDFLDAYEGNRQRGVEEAMEADPLAVAVLEIATERREYVGTATALLAEINSRVATELTREKSWPKDATRLSNRLRRVATALRALGVEVNLNHHVGRGEKKTRAIQLSHVGRVGTLNGPDGDAGKPGTVPTKYQQYQRVDLCGDGGDAGDAEFAPLSSSSPWETTI